jgi:hypothetical protein
MFSNLEKDRVLVNQISMSQTENHCTPVGLSLRDVDFLMSLRNISSERLRQVPSFNQMTRRGKIRGW